MKKIFATSKSKEKQLKKLNYKLLKHLESALEIMEITKCPYFILDGYGSIYMDLKYIKRNSIEINKNETNRLNELNSPKGGYFDKRIDYIAEEVTKLAESMTKKRIEAIKSKDEPRIKVGKTLDDLLNSIPKETKTNIDADLENSNEVVESFPEISKEQALEQVKLGQKTKNWEMVSTIAKDKAKLKIKEKLNTEDNK